MTCNDIFSFEKTVRAAVIAHAIRLGKCPSVGTIVDFKLGVDEIDSDDLKAGRLDKTESKVAARRMEFTVTAEDIEAGKKLINDQEAVYSEPKMTLVQLAKPE